MIDKECGDCGVEIHQDDDLCEECAEQRDLDEEYEGSLEACTDCGVEYPDWELEDGLCVQCDDTVDGEDEDL